jgi:hypothetical protein
MNKTVYLFPNTGHHYYFFPLALPPDRRQDIAAFEAAEKLKLPAENLHREIGERAAKGQWQAAKGRPWLRWRYGERTYGRTRTSPGIRAIGIWLAVETNLGDRRRGYVWTLDDRPEQNDSAWLAYKELREQGEPEPSPYYRPRPNMLPHSETIDLVAALGLKPDLPGIAELTLEILWPDELGEVIPVHLIVDFGNARTIVLALEERQLVAAGSLHQICRPVQFGHSLEDASKIRFLGSSPEDEPDPIDWVPESWFVLREPPFSSPQFRPPNLTMDDFDVEEQVVRGGGFLGGFFAGGERTHSVLRAVRRRAPQMFVELSPALIGPEAAIALASADPAQGGRYYMSSPKRYAWDVEPVGTGGGAFWTMLPNSAASRDPHGLPRKLGGEMLRFLPELKARQAVEDPSAEPPPMEWENLIEQPVADPSAPNYSRSDALIWTVLSILEHSNRQINSEAFRKDFQPLIPRRLASITVTRPSGWTRGEIRAYWAAWRDARNIFYWSREPYWDGAPSDPQWHGRPPYPEIDMLLDEGVASQLAIVYSEIRHLGERGRDWVGLFGKRRGSGPSVRVMSVDIGGGTTDTSIVEYRDAMPDGIGTELVPSLLFNDSSTSAGDQLALDLIERVLLPTIGHKLNDPGLRSGFVDALRSKNEREKAELSLITRTVFMPLVLRWFKDFEENVRGSASKRPWTPEESGTLLDSVTLFNKKTAHLGEGLLSFREPLSVDYDAIDRIIRGWCREMADLHARLIAAFDCDVVVVTGKPSELPQLRVLMEERLPLDLHRLIFARGYFAGEWFPCTRPDLAIPDAKMVTVAGAALYTAVTCDARLRDGNGEGHVHGPLLHNFRMRPFEYQAPARNYWVVMGTERRPMQARDVILNTDQEVSEPREISGTVAIGRVRFPGMYAEPVYVLRVYGGGGQVGTRSARIRLRRNSHEGGVPLPSEELEFEVVGAADGLAEAPELEVRLRTLPLREEHWLDRGRFEVRWVKD